MSTSVVYRAPKAKPGSARAQGVTAGIVIALSALLAGLALATGMAVGTALDTPADRPGVDVTQPANPTTNVNTSTASDQTGEGSFSPTD